MLALFALRNVLFCLLVATPLAAQPAPLVGTTLRTTATTAGSVRVGCAQLGACTGGIAAGPIDVASVTSGGFIGIASNVPSIVTMRLYNNAGTLTWNGVALATGASLSGTLNAIPVFTGTNSVGNSIIAQNAGATEITVAGGLTVATTITGTIATTIQNSVITMTGLTAASSLATVGTITTGVWNGTIIGLAFGGTGANLSGTGGTSQFLRQNTVGGTITVVRPAISDLSDGTNLALLNASNTFTRATATSNELNLINTTSGTTALAFLSVQAGTAQGYLSTYSQGWSTSGTTIASGTRLANLTGGGLALASINAAGNIGLYTGAAGTLRWGVNPSGDWLVGTANVADAAQTPTITSGFGAGATIAGRGYAFRVTIATGGSTSGIVNLNLVQTFAQEPVCVASNRSGSSAGEVQVSATTTAVTVSKAAGFAVSDIVNVVCRGY